MRIRWAVLLFLITSLHTIGQDYIVIDTNQSNLNIREHNDTLWNTQPYQYNVLLDIDTDGDSICDYKLKSDGYMGSGGYTENLYLISYGPIYGLNSFVVDTLVIDSIHNHVNNTYHVDTFNIVEKYSYGDTVSWSGPFMYQETHMINCFYQSWMFGPEISMCINFWEGEESYIGIKTIHEGREYLGWIKIEVQSGFFVVVKESVIYDPAFMIENHQRPEVKIYPNPAGDYFVFDTESFSELQILNLSGQLFKASQLEPGKNKLDIKALPAGLYILKFLGNDKIATSMLVKKK